MNWLIGTGAVILLAWAIGGVIGTHFLTKRIGPAIARALQQKWEAQDAARILRTIVILGVVVVILPWSIFFTTIGSMADQYFRNMVNEWMSGPDLFRELAIEPAEYHSLPLYWRQTLSEIVLRDGDEAEAIKQFISRLDIDELQILGDAAHYALSDALVVEPSQEGGDSVGRLSEKDLQHLEDIGIIKSTLTISYTFTEDKWINGSEYGLRVRGAKKPGTVTIMWFTETGSAIVRSMRRETSVAYLCRIRTLYAEKDVEMEIWTIDYEGSNDGRFLPMANVSSSCKIFK